MEKIPTSILISIDPMKAINLSLERLKNKKLSKLKQKNKSKNQKFKSSFVSSSSPNSSSSSISSSSSSSSSTYSSSSSTSFSSKSNQIQRNEELPALPFLPPTPLTPQDLLQSTTLCNLFNKSNTVFTQISDSITGLIQTDLSIGNKLDQLCELLRGDLNSRSSIELIQHELEERNKKRRRDDSLQDQPSELTESNQHKKIHLENQNLIQYQILNQNLEIIQSLFISPNPIKLQINKNEKKNQLHFNSNQQQHQNAQEIESIETSTRTIQVDEQKEIYQTSLIKINKFLADLKDYRSRLIELRNGCLGIEKRRRAMWYLIKLCCFGFNEIMYKNLNLKNQQMKKISAQIFNHQNDHNEDDNNINEDEVNYSISLDPNYSSSFNNKNNHDFDLMDDSNSDKHLFSEVDEMGI